jgi:hypothetical protein
MNTKIRITAITMCIAFLSTQFISCKKDNVDLTAATKSKSVDDAVADSSSSLNNGLIAWYTFNGDVLDHSGHNNNVIFNSAKSAKGKSGLPKTAYLFDGVSSYMQVANSTSLNPLKISLYALVKPTGFYQGVCHGNRIISKESNDYDQGKIALGFDDAAYYNYTGCNEPVQNKFENFYGVYGDGPNASGAKDVRDYVKQGQWYSIVYTYDGTNSKLYVNGVLVNKVVQSNTFNPNSNPLFIGRNQDVQYPYYFKGIIDEIRIYKRAITAKEVSELNSTN